MENLLTDENRDQIVIPASIEGQHKTLRNYAESLGLQSKLYGSGKIPLNLIILVLIKL